MTPDEIKSCYARSSTKILDSTKTLATDSYGMLEVFTGAKIGNAKKQLIDYYTTLGKLDDAYSECLQMTGSLNDLMMKNAKLATIERSRVIFMHSLDCFQRELSNVETSLNFKISTTMALVAIIFSIVGISM